VEQNATCAAARDENAVQGYLTFRSVTRIVGENMFVVKHFLKKIIEDMY